MTRPMPLLDLTFLLLDRPESPSNVGVLMLFDPPAGRRASVAAAQIARAYRSAKPAPPFDALPDLSVLALPRWRSAERVDLRRHVLRETLEAPGDVYELCRHVARRHGVENAGVAAEPVNEEQHVYELHDGVAHRQRLDDFFHFNSAEQFLAATAPCAARCHRPRGRSQSNP